MPLPQLLLTRPAPEAARLAAALQGRAEIVISPLMRIVPLDPPDLSGAAGLILTSPNALRAVPHLPALPCYVVGPRTAEAAEAAGGHVALVAEDAEALLAGLMARPPAGPLWHLRGEHARGDVAGGLRAAGMTVEERILYRQEATELSAAALDVLRGSRPVVLPLYSPRSAQIFLSAAPGVRAPLHLVALSPAVAEAAQAGGASWASVTVAARPEGDAMRRATEGRLDAVARLEAGRRGV